MLVHGRDAVFEELTLLLVMDAAPVAAPEAALRRRSDASSRDVTSIGADAGPNRRLELTAHAYCMEEDVNSCIKESHSPEDLASRV